ncbi:hypothetical protein RND81_12G124500 [Saponaria officinalis]|uniref:Uncharacterized protein n=1 Tax=Saponaria officinalis TaxID=3572 RepID=A0AAW1H9Q2_SAPOF
MKILELYYRTLNVKPLLIIGGIKIHFFICRVMELPESSNAHWKAKFIDDLPYLFAERVRTVLRGQLNSIPYDAYSYGKLIGTCTEQGLKLCNEIKLTQQIKRQNLAERNCGYRD